MTMHEFQSKLGATHTTNRLFGALRRLCAVEDPKAMLSEEATTNGDWIIWGGVTEPGHSAQASWAMA